MKIPAYMNLLARLAEITYNTPDREFDMATWGDKITCSTRACLAGHASLDPWFKDRGFHSKWIGITSNKTLIFSSNDTTYHYSALKPFNTTFNLNKKQYKFIADLFYCDLGITKIRVLNSIEKEASKYKYELEWLK